MSTWLYRIAVNASLMNLRKDRRKEYLAQTGYDDTRLATWTEEPEAAAINSELKTKLDDWLALPSLQLRLVVAIRDVQGFSNDEEAEIFDTSIRALESKFHRRADSAEEVLVRLCEVEPVACP